MKALSQQLQVVTQHGVDILPRGVWNGVSKFIQRDPHHPAHACSTAFRLPVLLVLCRFNCSEQQHPPIWRSCHSVGLCSAVSLSLLHIVVCCNCGVFYFVVVCFFYPVLSFCIMHGQERQFFPYRDQSTKEVINWDEIFCFECSGSFSNSKSFSCPILCFNLHLHTLGAKSYNSVVFLSFFCECKNKTIKYSMHAFVFVSVRWSQALRGNLKGNAEHCWYQTTAISLDYVEESRRDFI